MKQKKTNLANCFFKVMAFNRIAASILISAVLALSACVPLPVPWPSDSPRYSHEQIAKIQEGYSSRDEVVSVLGGSDIQRLGDRYWVYQWKVDSGKLFAIPLLPITAGTLGPLVSKRFILFLEFDEKGILLSKQFGDKIENKYCTASGLCLEHDVHVGYLSSGTSTYDFRNMDSAFTIRSSKDSVPWPASEGDRCVVVLWPDSQDWKDLQGLRLAIGNPPQGPPNWFWLPIGSYLALSLSAGQQSVRATDAIDPIVTFDSAENFKCEANQTIYMEIGKISKSRGWIARDQISIVLRAIDPETGRKAIAEMPRLLPP
jgi:hypothetical protein